MRRAELVMAAALGLFSLYLMYMSQIPPLEIGWVRLKGPGSGAFPFWLSLIMLITCVVIFVRGWRRMTPQSQSDETFLSPYAFKLFATTSLAIFAMLFLTTYISAYLAIFLFLMFSFASSAAINGRHLLRCPHCFRSAYSFCLNLE